MLQQGKASGFGSFLSLLSPSVLVTNGAGVDRVKVEVGFFL